MAIQLIINADDFGANASVNAAVERAYREGVLTSASLMMTGQAVEGAVSIARANPGLAVGLHVVLSCGASMLGHEAVPALTDTGGRFRADPVRAAFRYYFDPRARRQLRLEIEAQFSAFAATGLPLSHVDGHQHLHAHPAALPIVIEQAIKSGADGIRVPGESLLFALRADRSRPLYKLTTALGHAYLARVCRTALWGTGLVRCGVCIGSMMSGRMTSDYVIDALKAVRAKSVEVYFHPATQDSGDAFGPNAGDLNALLNPRLKEFIATQGYELTSYGSLGQGGSTDGDHDP
jgi:hopanoid biosynthesis associated protein HpnK